MDHYTKFTLQTYNAYLLAGNFPKRGRFRGKPAPDDKQQTVRPYPVETGSDGSIIMKSDVAITFAPSTEITKIEAQALGTFPDPIED